MIYFQSVSSSRLFLPLTSKCNSCCYFFDWISITEGKEFSILILINTNCASFWEIIQIKTASLFARPRAKNGQIARYNRLTDFVIFPLFHPVQCWLKNFLSLANLLSWTSARWWFCWLSVWMAARMIFHGLSASNALNCWSGNKYNSLTGCVPISLLNIYNNNNNLGLGVSGSRVNLWLQ